MRAVKNKLMKISLQILFFIAFSVTLAAQATVGLTSYTPDGAQGGYVLLAPTGIETIYLLNNCGESVHTWESDTRPGAVTYLLEDGSLLRAEKVNGEFTAGGFGGKIKIISWEGEVLWDYTYADENTHQHHDVELLPNGNILAIAWSKKPAEEIYALGRTEGSIDEALWLPQIREFTPVGLNDAEIVWEWNAIDHLSQDTDASLPGFGVAAHPELIDVNYNSGNGNIPGPSDWAHLNAIDYNPELDQIVVSSRSFSEIWIIDHSTTTEEAAGHTGGNAGMGGDLLYRWGNPITYKRGTAADRTLYGQHDSQWVESGLNDAGKLLVYNNGNNRPTGSFSTVDIWAPPMNEDGTYAIEDNAPFAPAIADWIYGDDDQVDFFSQNISGAQRLPNGNTIICAGRNGRILEIDEAGNLVWEYVNPVLPNGFAEQGDTPENNSVFRAYRYATDYPAFAGRDLSDGVRLELNPFVSPCMNTNTASIETQNNLFLYPNPAQNLLQVDNLPESGKFSICTLLGSEVRQGQYLGTSATVNLSKLPAGVYIFKTSDRTPRKFIKE